MEKVKCSLFHPFLGLLFRKFQNVYVKINEISLEYYIKIIY